MSRELVEAFRIRGQSVISVQRKLLLKQCS